MKSPARPLLRAAVALAAAGATALGLTAASAAVQSPAGWRHHHHHHRACTAGRLTTWMGVPGSGAAGTIYYELEFSNTSHVACALSGYPKVVATSGGKRVGPASRHDTMFRARTVVLRPGATAHAVLGIVAAGNLCANPVSADGLRVFAPHTRIWAPVSFGSFQVCPRQPVLHVRVVRRGVGIPGYSQ